LWHAVLSVVPLAARSGVVTRWLGGAADDAGGDADVHVEGDAVAGVVVFLSACQKAGDAGCPGPALRAW
jgi:hypothetical protein